MNHPYDLLAAVADGGDPGPFVLLRREGVDHLELFTGPVHVADRLADLPLPEGGPAPGRWRWCRTGRSPNGASSASTTASRWSTCRSTGTIGSPLADVLAALPTGPVRTGRRRLRRHRRGVRRTVEPGARRGDRAG